MYTNEDNVPTSAFISIHQCLSSKLINNVVVYSQDASVKATAQWDTGATTTCIAKHLVDDLHLVPTGMTRIQTPSGTKVVSNYLIDIILPNNVRIANIAVCETEIGSQGIDVLIGMDIILNGDFSVSNYVGQTSFTFRIPSRKKTDYVAEVNAEKMKARIGTHGKGKRKRK